MKEVGRKIFYDNVNGNIILDKGEMQDGVIEETIDEIISKFTALSERNRDTFDVLELPYGAYESDFLEGRLIGVNLETKEPLFEYHNSDNPSEPIIPDKPFSVQIAELKTENVALKADNEALKVRDSGLADDVIFILDTLMSNNLIIE